MWVPNKRILRDTCMRGYAFESEVARFSPRSLCEYAADVVASAKYMELGLTGAARATSTRFGFLTATPGKLRVAAVSHWPVI